MRPRVMVIPSTFGNPEARAEEFHSPAFVQHFRDIFGVEPTVTYLDILVLVDNRAGGDVVANQ